MDRCVYIDPRGNSCGGFHTKDSKYCFRHDPTKKELALSASQKGGSNRKLQSKYGVEIKLENTTDIKNFLANVINSVWTGKVPVQVGTSMGFLTRCWLDAYEATELDKKLSDIENVLYKQ